MIAPKVTDSFKKDGKLISVTLELQDKEEIEIYKRFLADEPAFQKCPKCQQSNTIGDDDLQLRIDNPLANTLGMQLATPIMHCDHCGELIDLSMMDYSCFRSVVSWISQLRARAAQLKKG